MPPSIGGHLHSREDSRIGNQARGDQRNRHETFKGSPLAQAASGRTFLDAAGIPSCIPSSSVLTWVAARGVCV